VVTLASNQTITVTENWFVGFGEWFLPTTSISRLHCKNVSPSWSKTHTICYCMPQACEKVGTDEFFWKMLKKWN